MCTERILLLLNWLAYWLNGTGGIISYLWIQQPHQPDWSSECLIRSRVAQTQLDNNNNKWVAMRQCKYTIYDLSLIIFRCKCNWNGDVFKCRKFSHPIKLMLKSKMHFVCLAFGLWLSSHFGWNQHMVSFSFARNCFGSCYMFHSRFSVHFHKYILFRVSRSVFT